MLTEHLTHLCTPNGFVFPRAVGSEAYKVYFNRRAGEIQFSESFGKYFGFTMGRKIAIYEHFQDPFTKFLICLVPDVYAFGFTLSGWGKTKHKTCVKCGKFFEAMSIPVLPQSNRKTKKSNRVMAGEKGLNIWGRPLYYGNYVLFEFDITKAKLADSKSPNVIKA